MHFVFIVLVLELVLVHSLRGTAVLQCSIGFQPVSKGALC